MDLKHPVYVGVHLYFGAVYFSFGCVVFYVLMVIDFVYHGFNNINIFFFFYFIFLTYHRRFPFSLNSTLLLYRQRLLSLNRHKISTLFCCDSISLKTVFQAFGQLKIDRLRIVGSVYGFDLPWAQQVALVHTTTSSVSTPNSRLVPLLLLFNLDLFQLLHRFDRVGILIELDVRVNNRLDVIILIGIQER